ncbi:MAG TPA: hypothetical protein PLJ12_02410, partial [Planctomycetota bacterium]|nr:hypothetical protein [Planctomycetota bacterium]
MRFATFFGLLLGSLALPACFAPTIDATARWIQLQPKGEIGIADSTVTTRNSLDDLGLGSKEGIPGAMVDFQWGGPHLSVSTQSGSWSGSGTLQAEFSNNGTTIPIGTDVDSNLDLAIHSALLTWDLLPGDAELGFGFGVDALDLKGSFQSQSSSDRIDFDETIPIPVLAIRANVHINSFELGGSAAGFKINYNGDDAQFLDMDLMARYHFIGGSSR